MTRSVCIGVDVGGTNLRCALVGRDGAILRRSSEPTDIAAGRENFMSRLTGVLARLQGEAAADGVTVAAAGIGVPGLILGDGTIHSSVNLVPLEGVSLAESLSRSLRLPVLALNDANACALGERRFGAGRPYRSTLTLTIGTGVGAGLILAGRLWTGIDGVAGEFGHLTVEPEGLPCGCDNRGCLEQYLSAPAIARAFGLSGKGSGDAAAVAALALTGDAGARAVFRRAGSYLGIACAGVVNLLNLEAVILGGGVARSFELIAEAARSEIAARAFAIPAARVAVLKGELGDDAGLIGAAAAAFDAA